MKTTLADEGGRLVSVLQVRAAKKYRAEVTVDLADGSRKRWHSDGIKYPKGVKTKNARDWAAEASFAAVWRPTEDGVCVVRLGDDRHNIEAEAEAQAPLPAREKRPRDCQAWKQRRHVLTNAAELGKGGGGRVAPRARGGCGSSCRPTMGRSARGFFVKRRASL